MSNLHHERLQMKEADYNNPLPSEIFAARLHRPSIRIGSIFFVFACILSYLPVIVLWVVYGIVPSLSEIISLMTLVCSASIAWWVVEPISYFPILGTAGTYVAFLIGGLSVRVPCAMAAQAATNSEPGSQRGEIMATMGIAGSTVMKFIFILFGVLGESLLLGNISETFQVAFQYVPVSIYMSLLSRLMIKRPDISTFGMVCSVLLLNFGTLMIPSYLLLLLNVMLCAIFSALLYKRCGRK